MKLRIHGNAIRLRLSRPEVVQFSTGSRVESSVQFPDGSALVYALEQDPAARDLIARYDGRAIIVSAPRSLIAAWAESDQVGMSKSDGQLEIVVEKDFQCLHKGDAAKDPNAYPNPAALPVEP
jgi:hypothetical protein